MRRRIEKLFHKAVRPLVKIYHHVVRPVTIGVRALVLNDAGDVLLVQHSYGRQWYLPGGGLEKGETLLQALGRELAEELGLEIKTQPTLLGTYSNFYEGKRDFVSVFVVREYAMTPRGSAEIAHLCFFPPSALPENTSPGTKKRVQEFKNERITDFRW